MSIIVGVLHLELYFVQLILDTDSKKQYVTESKIPLIMTVKVTTKSKSPHPKLRTQRAAYKKPYTAGGILSFHEQSLEIKSIKPTWLTLKWLLTSAVLATITVENLAEYVDTSTTWKHRCPQGTEQFQRLCMNDLIISSLEPGVTQTSFYGQIPNISQRKSNS